MTTTKKHLRTGLTNVCVTTALILIIALYTLASPAQAEEIKDADITLAVETELLVDEAVPSHLIDVETKNHIVTLSGSVENLLAKERAEKIAGTIKGVRSVVNTIEVKPAERSDAEIRSDVALALVADPATDSYETNVSVKDGIVTLKGAVDSWQEKQLCGLVAKSVKGVKALNNQISVDYDEERPDREIKAEIEQALEMNVWIDENFVDVKVEDGEVTLSGTARSDAEKAEAYAEAWVTGVKSVDDSALLVNWPKYDDLRRNRRYVVKSDEEIKNAIEGALMYDPRVFSFNPTVEVDSGVVTLTGVVQDLKAKEAAEKDAKNTTGVWRVKNNLRVRPLKQPDDQTMENNIEAALIRDPFVERFEITPVVVNGKAYLYGTVDTLFEKSQAEDVASRVKGVIEIENNLRILDTVVVREKGDWEIKDDIEGELWWSPFVDADEVTVTVGDGVATLTGTVDTWSERMAAEENALEGGAIRVINKLSVEYGPAYYLP